MDDEISSKFENGVAFLKAGRSWTEAYTDMVGACFSTSVIEDGLRVSKPLPLEQLPSFDQFIYWAKKGLRRGDVVRATSGETKFARENRARLGTARDMAFGPGSIYQIDATVANIYLRSRLNPALLIGRPVLYFVVDHYSRMIVGFTVALTGPSWEIAKLALENAFTDKVSFCARYGVIISEDEWPCHHPPRQLTGDRGWDVIGKHAVASGKALDLKVVNLPPYRPDYKGLVEGRFELIDMEMRFIPGRSHSRERGEPKHKLDAVHTTHTLTQYLISRVRKYNTSFAVKDPPSDYVSPNGMPPTPLDLWIYGCRNRGAPALANPDRVRASLLHVGEARESDQGLRFEGLHYAPSEGDVNDWFVRVHRRKWNARKVRYDPRDVSTILLPVERESRFVTLRLTPKDDRFRGWTLDEVKDHRVRARIGSRLAEERRLNANARANAEAAEIESRARAELADVPRPRAQQKANREARAAEVREIRRQEAWTQDAVAAPASDSATTPTAPSVAVVAAPAPSGVIEGGSPERGKPDHFDKLRARRDAARTRQKENEDVR